MENIASHPRPLTTDSSGIAWLGHPKGNPSQDGADGKQQSQTPSPRAPNSVPHHHHHHHQRSTHSHQIKRPTDEQAPSPDRGDGKHHKQDGHDRPHYHDALEEKNEKFLKESDFKVQYA